jgi:hypothetical protein
MALMLGSAGQKVRHLQDALNKLPPSSLPPLNVDGRFGPKTFARVKEFQSNNHLVVDGIVGPATLGMILKLLESLSVTPPAPPAPASDVTVYSITQTILGMPPTNGLIQQIFPAVQLIDVPTFQPGNASNAFLFTGVAMATARLGIFAAQKASSAQRAVILVLPGSGVPDRVVIGITHGFGQNADYYGQLGWEDPLSPLLIDDVLLRFVIKRWGPQVLAVSPPAAFVLIVRAVPSGGSELGPFAADGGFVREVLTQMSAITQGAFAVKHVEAFTYSSGIHDFNKFVPSLIGHLTVEAVHNIDPTHGIPTGPPPGAKLRQFLSGHTTGGAPRPGFEFMRYQRWKNEPFFAIAPKNDFAYMHNFVLPQYTLHLGMSV